jgi:long-chain acyl-CoA synthetase
MTHPSLHAARHPDKIVYRIADSDEMMTYGELEARSNQAAHLLRQLGLKAGDHFAGLLSNRLDMLVIAWAAQRSGLYFTPISTHLPAAEVAYIVDNSGAKALITEAMFEELIARLPEDLTGRVVLFCVGDPIPGFRRFDLEMAAMPETPITDQVTGYNMFYSSGTTGRPKGIKPPFTGADITMIGPLQLKLCRDVTGLGPDAVYLSPAPLYHAAPLLFVMMAAALGGEAVIERKFDAESFLRHVEQYRITHSQLVPTMFVRMLKLTPEVRSRYDLSSLRCAVHAAAPCPEHVKRAMIDWWGPILVEYYGASEAYGVTMVDSRDWLDHPGTVGRAVVGEVRIVGEDGRVLGPREVGTLYFANGPKFSYHGEPEKTAQAFNAQGWATVGDVGYVDEEGYLYLTDRKAYVINSGGVNVYPQQCEDLLTAHEAVLDAAVFGVPDEDMGEVVKAVVQLAPGFAPSAELEAALITYCRDHLASIACPRSVDFVSELPRTPTGKLNKRFLRDQYWQKAGKKI